MRVFRSGGFSILMIETDTLGDTAGDCLINLAPFHSICGIAEVEVQYDHLQSYW